MNELGQCKKSVKSPVNQVIRKFVGQVRKNTLLFRMQFQFGRIWMCWVVWASWVCWASWITFWKYLEVMEAVEVVVYLEVLVKWCFGDNICLKSE